MNYVLADLHTDDSGIIPCKNSGITGDETLSPQVILQLLINSYRLEIITKRNILQVNELMSLIHPRPRNYSIGVLRSST